MHAGIVQDHATAAAFEEMPDGLARTEKGPRRFTARTWSKSLMSISWLGIGFWMPALFTSTSSRSELGNDVREHLGNLVFLGDVGLHDQVAHP